MSTSKANCLQKIEKSHIFRKQLHRERESRMKILSECMNVFFAPRQADCEVERLLEGRKVYQFNNFFS